MKTSIGKWLTEQFGDPDLIAQIYEVYCSDFKKGFNELVLFLEQRDLPNIAKKAHALKGMALMVGDTEIAEHCRAIEMSGKENNFTLCETTSAILTPLVNELD